MKLFRGMTMFEGQCKWDISDFASNEALDLMPGGLFIYHVDDDQFIYVSQNMLDMLGYTEESFRKKFDNRFSELVYYEDREATLSTIVDQVSDDTFDTCIYRIEKADGSLMWVKDEGHLVKIPSGRECFFVTIIDITDLMQKNALYNERRQQEYDSAMHELLTANPNAICAYKLNLTQNTCSDCHGASEFIEKFLDAKTVDEILSRVGLIMMDDYSTKWFVANISREQLLAKYDRGERRVTIAYRRLREAGKPLWVKSFCRMLENPTTHDIEAIIYTIDIDKGYKEENILTKICDEFYDCFGLIGVTSGRVHYYYGENNLIDVDIEQIVSELEVNDVYYCFLEKDGLKKQLNFFYFDEQKEYIIFTQIDMQRKQSEERGTDNRHKYSAIADLLSKAEGERRVRELLDSGRKGGFIVCDIDDFKITNDTFGHRIADRILYNFAAYFGQFFGDDDIVYRLKGDRFAAFVADTDKKDEILLKLNALYEDLSNVRVEGQPDLLITISAGAHIHTDPNETYDDMLRTTENRMWLAKNGGKNNFFIV